METKSRIDELAEKKGISAHRLMVEALLTGLEQEEWGREFIAASEAALDDVLTGAPVYSLASVDAVLTRQIEGGRPRKPERSAMAKVDLSAEAVEDLKHLTSFWLEKNPRWARATKQLILEALEVLARHPLMGRRRSARIRELVISRGATGYVASYALHLRTGDVVVLRIRHQRQRPR